MINPPNVSFDSDSRNRLKYDHTGHHTGHHTGQSDHRGQRGVRLVPPPVDKATSQFRN
jgi:hypothetical protein